MPSERKETAICSEVARLLKEERLRQGMTMTDLADAVGLSQQMVSYVERGMRGPTLVTLIRMADGLGIDLWKVIREASKPS